MESINSLKEELKKDDSVSVNIKIITKASCVKLEKIDEDNYKLKIREIAEKGRANQTIIDFFKNNLKPLKVVVEIKSGQASSFKKLKINLIK